jgi:hypothetical protein
LYTEMSNPFSATFSARFCPITASPHSPIRDFSPAPFAAVARVVAVIPRRRPARVVASRLRAAVVAFVVADLAAHAMVASRNRNRAQSNQSINQSRRPAVRPARYETACRVARAACGGRSRVTIGRMGARKRIWWRAHTSIRTVRTAWTSLGIPIP